MRASSGAWHAAQLTNSRSSSRMGQRSGGSFLAANRTPHCSHMKLIMCRTPLIAARQRRQSLGEVSPWPSRSFLLKRSGEKAEQPRVVAQGTATGDVAIRAHDHGLSEAGS